MRKTWKEVGLGLLNLLAVVAVIAAAQPVIRKLFGAAGAVGAVGAVVLAMLVLGAYLAATKWIERRAATEFAMERALPELGGGLLGGFGLFAVVMAILWMVGVYHPAGWGTSQGLAKGLMLALVAGVLEEILFRGLLFRLSAKVVGTWGALLLTAALFGAAHAANRGATVSSSVAIALEAGILLGAAYAATGRLWVPIGLHMAWNFTEGSVFGMTLSGFRTDTGLIRGSIEGPRILTGGEFGPEASIVAVVVCCVAAGYFLWRMVKDGRGVQPVWKKKTEPVPVPATAATTT